MKIIRLADATASQLAEFATTNLGIEIDHRAGVEKILARMDAVGFDKETIEVPDVAPIVAQKPLTADEIGSLKTVTIEINEDGTPGGTEPVWLSVNCRAQWVPRGVPSVITLPYLEALKNAVKRDWRTDANGTLTTYKDVPIHSYSIISYN